MRPETTSRTQGTIGTAKTILAQPLHPRVRRIVEHWASMGPPGRLPGRPHLDPLHIPRLLSNIWLLDVEREPRLRFRYRLIGTRVAEAFSSDATGRYLDEVQPEFEKNSVYRYLSEVVDLGLPSWRTGKPQLSALHEFVNIERIYLPLARNGETVDMILAFSIFLDRHGVEF